MSWRTNQRKKELINKFGETVDMPLFSGHRHGTASMPTYIFDGSKLKAEVYEKIKMHLSEMRFAVFCAIGELGKCTDHQIANRLQIELHRVVGRRHELQELGLIQYAGETTGPYDVKNILWTLNRKGIENYLRNCLP